jgi:hypothetical protein
MAGVMHTPFLSVFLLLSLIALATEVHFLTNWFKMLSEVCARCMETST